MKICKNENCNEEVHDLRKSYHAHNCYLKQQVIDQARRKEKLKATRRPVILTCEYSKCDNTFERNGAKKYCCGACRKEASNEREGVVVREVKVIKDIPEHLLVRGKIHYEGYSA